MVEEDGVYYECEAGCCHEGKGCPGQCSDVDPSPPYRVISHSDVYTTASVKYLTTIQIRDGTVLNQYVAVRVRTSEEDMPYQGDSSEFPRLKKPD
jgi:hypothetical protein